MTVKIPTLNKVKLFMKCTYKPYALRFFGNLFLKFEIVFLLKLNMDKEIRVRNTFYPVPVIAAVIYMYFLFTDFFYIIIRLEKALINK
jgi:hypothetical protein